VRSPLWREVGCHFQLFLGSPAQSFSGLRRQWASLSWCRAPISGLSPTELAAIFYSHLRLYHCQRSMVCPQYNTSWRLECAVSTGSHKTKKHNLPKQNRTCKRTNSTAITTTQPKKTKKELARRPTRRLMRNCFWIILFTLYWIIEN
jgi:hypothetical protein